LTTRPPTTPSATVPETRAPGVFLTAEWRQLLMVNYVVDPGVLTPLIPAGTELDLWQGRAYVSLVGFRFLNTRVWGLPIPFHRNFDEVNLRFYVRRRVGDEWRTGVTFVKEIVPRRAVAFVAKTLYNENYVRFPMRSTIAIPGRVQYEWRHLGAWEGLSAHAIGESFAPAPDSEEQFITEHYWGYARQRDDTTVEYAVEHVPWRVWRCESASCAGQVGRLYGERFIQCLTGPPQSAFVADGSAVVVRKAVRLL
jgi:uncharacterized protein